MYITLALTAVYTASSYYYNHYHHAQADDYRQKAGASFAIMQGSLAPVLNGIPANIYKKLLSDGMKLIPDYSYRNACLDGYIAKFGVHNMQSAVRALLEGEDLEELPYLYMPYHQYLKQSIGAIGVGEIIYQQFDTIRLLYDYQIGRFELSGLSELREVIRKYGLESILTLKNIGADFSGVSDYDIYHILNENGIESIKILMDAGIDLNNMSESFILAIVFSFGKDSILLLKNAGANFSQLYGDAIVGIAKEYGMDSLQTLKDSGADFNTLGPDDISHLILDQGIDVIQFLADVNVYFTKMGEKDIIPVLIKYGKNGIDALHSVGANLGVLSLSNVLSVIDNHGEEVIWSFKDAEVDFAKLSNQLNRIDTSDGSMTEAEFAQALASIGLNNFNFEYEL